MEELLGPISADAAFIGSCILIAGCIVAMALPSSPSTLARDAYLDRIGAELQALRRAINASSWRKK